jgi:Peptidase family S41
MFARGKVASNCLATSRTARRFPLSVDCLQWVTLRMLALKTAAMRPRSPENNGDTTLVTAFSLLTLTRTQLVATGTALLLLFAAIAAFAVWPATEPDWRALHRQDVMAMHDAIRDNHPGAVDDRNPAFARWLKTGMTEALAREAKINGAAGYFYSLAAYANGFGDTHLSVEPAFKPPALRWPGFIVALRNGRPAVVDLDPGLASAPPLGALIKNCDGKTLSQLIEARLLPFGFDQRVPANRPRAVSYVLLDEGNPLAPAPKKCLLETPKGDASIDLAYRPVPERFSSRLDAALLGPPAKLGWSEPAPGVTWIGIPSFNYDGANSARLRKLMDRLASDADRLRQGRAIVFDVRGNTGGSSLWGDEIRNSLWHPADVDRFSPRDPSGVDWRASPGNRDYMMDLISTVVPKVGSQSSVGRALTAIARGLSETAAKGQTYWREGNADPGPEGGLTKRRPRKEPPLFRAKIVILSNGRCASACLDFADRILQMPGTSIVGFATSGDGQYTESRAVPLPSGQARLHLSMKVYRGRPRGNMEVYEPDAAFDGKWDETHLRVWLLRLIEEGRLQ